MTATDTYITPFPLVMAMTTRVGTITMPIEVYDATATLIEEFLYGRLLRADQILLQRSRRLPDDLEYVRHKAPTSCRCARSRVHPL